MSDQGCQLDTDGDGNCPVHPNGCPIAVCPQQRQDFVRPSAEKQAERMCEDLATGLQLESAGAQSIPSADMLRRDIKHLEERLRIAPLDDYAPHAREMLDAYKDAIRGYHKEEP